MLDNAYWSGLLDSIFEQWKASLTPPKMPPMPARKRTNDPFRSQMREIMGDADSDSSEDEIEKLLMASARAEASREASKSFNGQIDFAQAIKSLTEQSTPDETREIAVPLIKKLAGFYKKAYWDSNGTVVRKILAQIPGILDLMHQRNVPVENIQKYANAFKRDYEWSLKRINDNLESSWEKINKTMGAISSEDKPDVVIVEESTLAPAPVLPETNFRAGFEKLHQALAAYEQRDTLLLNHADKILNAYGATGNQIFDFLAKQSAVYIDKFFNTWTMPDQKYFAALRILFSQNEISADGQNCLQLLKYLSAQKGKSEPKLWQAFKNIIEAPFMWKRICTESSRDRDVWFGLKDSQITYTNPLLDGQKWELQLGHSDPSLHLATNASFTRDQHEEMNRHNLHPGCHSYPDHIEKPWFSVQDSNDFQKFMDTIQTWFVFPKDLMAKEIEAKTTAWINKKQDLMTRLNKGVVDEDPEIVAWIQKELNENRYSSASSAVSDLLEKLEEQEKFVDYISWALILPKGDDYHGSIPRNALKMLEQMRADAPEEVPVSLLNPVNFYHLAYRIAKISGNPEDMDIAMGYLGEVSGITFPGGNSRDERYNENLLLNMAQSLKHANEKICQLEAAPAQPQITQGASLSPLQRRLTLLPGPGKPAAEKQDLSETWQKVTGKKHH